MDVFIPIVIFILVFLLFSICGFCCKRKRQGMVYGLAGTNVTVTTQHVAASPVVVPPYPVEPQHPVPQTTAAPGVGFVAPQLPYPMHPQHPVPAAIYYPPPMGATAYPPISSGAPYPPVGIAPYPDHSSLPPSYSEAVAQPPVTKEAYSKQAPYNPNY